LYDCVILALLVDIIVCASIKAVFRRKRPAQNADDMMTISVDQYSFPSGHATRVAMCSCFLISQFDLTHTVQTAIIAWAVIVCVSRIMLGRHHVSDVLAGALIGVLELVVMNWSHIWLAKDTVEHIIRPIQEELHL
jgi:presqualene diphosphate phosphatase